MRMYDYNSQYVELEELLTQGKITQEQFKDTLESFSDDWIEKAENVAKMIDNFKGQEEMLDAEIKKLQAKKKSISNKKDWLMQSLEEFLVISGKDELNVGLYKLGYAKNPPSVEIKNEKAVPKAYKVPQPPKIDKKAIAKALKDNETVRGAVLVTDNKRFEVKK